MEIDTYDLRILNQLDINARQSYSEIGKRINRSKQFVGHRIKKLEDKGIIKGYVTDIALREMGYMVFSIFLQLQKLDESNEKKIVEYLKKSDHVGFCLRALGNWDFFISAKAFEINDFYKFLADLHRCCAGLIKRESINLEIGGASTNLRFIGKDKGSSEYISTNYPSTERREIDDIEKQVILKLRGNAMISYLELAKHIGKSYETLIRIIKKLRDKKMIKRNRAIIDTEKLGYERYLFLIELHFLNNAKMQEILNYAKGHQNIDYIIECIGSWNLICNVYSKNIYELTQIIGEFKKKFGDSINSIEFLRIISNEKESFNL
jgi:DNA-binding Lrp family transcriptional regulator